MTFPTADHVAIGTVPAARRVGEGPLEVVGGGGALACQTYRDGGARDRVS